MVGRTAEGSRSSDVVDAALLSIAILRHVNEGIALIRVSDASIVFANPYFERMFGYATGELLDRHVSILNASGDADPTEVAEEIIAALRTEGRWEGELHNRRKDGSTFWSWASVSTFEHPELGRVWVTVQRDVSHRRLLQEQLVRAKAFLDSIVENIPDMVFVKDATDLSFVLFNRAGEELLGHRRADLIGKNDYDFFPKAEADFFTEKDRAVLRDKAVLEIAEEPIDTATHGVRLLRTKKIPIFDDSGAATYLLGISEDVTQLQEAERIRRRHEQTTTAVNAILRAVNTHVDVTAAFPEVCDGLRALASCSSATVAVFDERREWLHFVAADAPWPAGVSGGVRMRVSEYPGGPELVAGHAYEVPDLAALTHFPIVHYGHAIGFRSTLSVPLFAGQRVIGLLTLLWDSSNGAVAVDREVLAQAASALAIAIERHRLFQQVRDGHARLAVLSRRLLAVQETERRHLARELHDEIGQYLTGVSLLLSQLVHAPAEGFEARVAEVGRVVAELIDRVRDLSLDLRPAILDDFGLLPALRGLFERFERQAGLAVNFTQIGLDRRFASDVETAAYRIVQEALTNVARHARAGAVEVRATAGDEQIVVEVADRGSGFDVDAALASASSSGLSGMRERAALLGGSLDIESQLGVGTTIRAALASR